MKRKCLYPPCERTSFAKSLCKAHYDQMAKGQSLREIERRVASGTSPQDRVLMAVEMDPNSGCWLWIESLTPGGYGQLSYNGKVHRAHRFSYEAFVKRPEGKMVCHRCDTRSCCNPSHMFLGTSQDNIDDMVAKGRTCRGEKRSLSVFLSSTSRKVQVEDYPEILARREKGETLKSIAKDYGVHLVTIHSIVTGQRFAKGIVAAQKANEPLVFFNRAKQGVHGQSQLRWD